MSEKQLKNNKEISKFYPRLINKPDSTSSNEDYDLPNKGLKYKLHYKRKVWIRKLSLDISYLINIKTRVQNSHIFQDLQDSHHSIGPIGQVMDFLTLEDGTDMLSRNVGKGLQLDGA
jgi:hypothetical protein